MLTFATISSLIWGPILSGLVTLIAYLLGYLIGHSRGQRSRAETEDEP